MTSQDHTHEEPGTGPVIRDRRRIDPATGRVREQGPGTSRGKHARDPAGAEGGASAGHGAKTAGATDVTAAQLAERTADLQRVQAEYANYRKRVERDRMAVREQALANVLSELLPVLDDIGRAREHGELSGGFKSVAESLEATAAKLGLVRYGEAGEPFDPKVHEALLHSYSEQVTEPTCVQILQPGYKVADRILRPARVEVAEPASAEAPPAPEEFAVPEPPAPGGGAASAAPPPGQPREGTSPREEDAAPSTDQPEPPGNPETTA